MQTSDILMHAKLPITRSEFYTANWKMVLVVTPCYVVQSANAATPALVANKLKRQTDTNRYTYTYVAIVHLQMNTYERACNPSLNRKSRNLRRNLYLEIF